MLMQPAGLCWLHTRICSCACRPQQVMLRCSQRAAGWLLLSVVLLLVLVAQAPLLGSMAWHEQSHVVASDAQQSWHMQRRLSKQQRALQGTTGRRGSRMQLTKLAMSVTTSPGPPKATGSLAAPAVQPEQYLALCLAAKDQHLDLREWLDHHLALGVSKIYLFDDHSDPPMLPAVTRYAHACAWS